MVMATASGKLERYISLAHTTSSETDLLGNRVSQQDLLQSITKGRKAAENPLACRLFGQVLMERGQKIRDKEA